MISVAICTYNNAATLAMTLDSLRGLVCPPELEYEVLVIDNNSSDGTREIVAKHQEGLGPRLRYVFEAQQGLSHARNRAAKEAMGDIISYIDDDVCVDSRWLSAVAEAFARYSPAVVGGRSYLIYPSTPPPWLSEKHELFLSRLDFGEQVIVDIDRELFGLNFSVRKEWLERMGGFDTSLGRCGGTLLSGEEADLLKRIRAKGGIAVYEPKAIVGHMVSAARMKMPWFMRRCFAGGRSSMVVAINNGEPLPSVLEVVIRTVRCIGSIPKIFILGHPSEKDVADRILTAACALGRLDARIRLARRAARRERACRQTGREESSF